MDLGFGNANQVLGEATAKALLASTKAQEDAISGEMARYDALLESNDETLEQLREKRLKQLKAKQAQEIKWRQAGHGVYSELEQGQDTRDVARAFFSATKASERLVVCFYRPTSAHVCDILHSHLEKLAPKHLETRFLKVNVEQATFLVEKLGICVMPTMVLIQNNKVVHHIRGFDEMGGTLEFSTHALALVLASHGALTATHEEEEGAAGELKENFNVNAISISKKKHLRRGIYNEDFEEEE